MQVAAFSVGPLVGDCGRTSVRILGRADIAAATARGKAMLGRIQWRPRPVPGQGETDWTLPLAFRMNSNFDGSGVVVLNDLLPGVEYEYRAGWVTDENVAGEQLDWARITPGRFRTAPADDTAPVSFLFGSCCYRFFDLNGLVSDDRADKTFGAMLTHQRQYGDVDFVMLCGDQIYADPLNRLGAISAEEQYLSLYRKVFGQPNMRELMATTPTYMILDDHEIEDNWPASASKEDWVGKLPAALKAYQIYQASHGPAMPLDPSGRYLDCDPDHLWYSFRRGCVDMFVMDVRTERHLAETARERMMISGRQEQALVDWLLDGSDRVKLIVSPVVVFPDQRRWFRRKDAWEGFVAQRARILEVIRRNRLQRVAFLSGDVHASLVAALHSRQGGQDVTMYNLVCSGLFWPTALMAFRWYSPMVDGKGRLATGGLWSRYRVELLKGLYSRDAFARVDVTRDGFRYRLYDRRGDPLPEFWLERSWQG
ncbi:hypothetical protein S7S_11735 [Isoalcanivorax pacificus W11-5]|uniref:PhoD-like phosphatase metallophosphatase domain-containing protein n=1 Tax=Isoalcanivorax pacificus W11-5 TaxID=391936 RepID=A0A0B4XKF2_9GAMM|nr:alkaline phosphatase D family protein [Isoalcanivorax pacificus]AJD48759.1 hypothetical protein S7S_11735 [Isoalcanivorax pacificus W11-5]